MYVLITIAGSFLIPIIVFNILGAMPIVYMELIMGQYSQSGAIPVWNVCPLLKGLPLYHICTHVGKLLLYCTVHVYEINALL